MKRASLWTPASPPRIGLKLIWITLGFRIELILEKHLSYGKNQPGQVFVYLLQVWLSGFVGKPLVNLILEIEFS